MVVLGKLVTLAGPARPRVKQELSELGVIDRGAMIVENGRITWIGHAQELPPTSQEIIDHRGKVITPGLIDAHAHPVFANNRCNEFAMRCGGATYQDIAAAGGGILSTVRATRQATQEELVEQGKRHIAWMLANGTTTAEAKSGYGLTTADELKMLRAIKELSGQAPVELIPTFLGAHAIPPEHKANPQAYIDEIQTEMLPAVAQEGLAEYADAFLEDRYFTLDACRSILTQAQSLGLAIRLHADQLTKSGGAQLAAELKAKTADHLEQTDRDGIEALVRAGVQPVLLPGSVYALGLTKYPLARHMIDAGLAIVVATDFNPGSSPVPSLPAAMSLACTQMKMSPAEALTATTINAAYSLDRGHDRGSLEPGKRADFVLWDCEEPDEIAYWLGATLVKAVYIRGKRITI